MGRPRTRHIMNQGPCPQCGVMFQSAAPKIFCSLKCYKVSPQFKVNQQRAVEAARQKAHDTPYDPEGGYTRTCLECGKEEKVKLLAQSKRKFCSQSHYFAYMAKRFDRYIANPEQIEGLPQAFDEFLDQQELPCLVKGCDWHGKSLSLHMNLKHGIMAVDFKKAVGFNQGVGIISAPLRKHFEQRERTWLTEPENLARLHAARAGNPAVQGGMVRDGLQARERRIKGAAIRAANDILPDRKCIGCDTTFTPRTGISFSVKFCGASCRERYYARTRPTTPATCAQCGEAFQANYSRMLRMRRGKQIVCSIKCRQIMNAKNLRNRKEPSDD